MLKFAILMATSAILTNYLFELPFFQNYLNLTNQEGSIDQGTYLFTPEELATYNGADNKPLYLSIIGQVYDVSKGVKFYGKGETYHTFVAKDNSRNFVTGDLDEANASDKVIPFTAGEFRSLKNWADFYKKEYRKVGKLIGRFYNDNGKLTPYGREVKLLIKQAQLAQEEDDAEKLKFPPCNIEWEAKLGTRVWCTKKSGGIERDWVGVPRQLYEVGADNWRCACIHEGNKNLGNIKEYEGCEAASVSCFVANDN